MKASKNNAGRGRAGGHRGARGGGRRQPGFGLGARRGAVRTPRPPPAEAWLENRRRSSTGFVSGVFKSVCV